LKRSGQAAFFLHAASAGDAPTCRSTDPQAR